MSDSLPERRRHQHQVLAYLSAHLGGGEWRLDLPGGRGHETYIAYGAERTLFVKLGVHLLRYQALDSSGVTPPLLAAGYLPDGVSIIIQQHIAGRTPTRADFCERLPQFATILRQVHQNPALQSVLTSVSSDFYSAAGLAALARLEQTWRLYRPQVPGVADFVDASLVSLAQQIRRFEGRGLVASHNDVCNGNWLLGADGRLYLVDFELMRLDDPALDLGALLWWYYPPSLRQRFLEIAGYANDAALPARMRVRMALHCLFITLPRPESFDSFNPNVYAQELADFRAIMAGEENPQGYAIPAPP